MLAKTPRGGDVASRAGRKHHAERNRRCLFIVGAALRALLPEKLWNLGASIPDSASSGARQSIASHDDSLTGRGRELMRLLRSARVYTRLQQGGTDLARRV